MWTGLLLLPWLMHAAETNRLNILFCFADDWGRYASCYAKIEGGPSLNDIVKTPNVDRVAREGVMFRNAFVPAPSTFGVFTMSLSDGPPSIFA